MRECASVLTPDSGPVDSTICAGPIMDVKPLLWYLVLSSLTVAYLVVLAGVKAAKSHDVTHHSHRMIVGCTIVGIWLVAYVLKQILFGRESFQGPERAYWSIYVPIFVTHMLLAITTSGTSSAGSNCG